MADRPRRSKLIWVRLGDLHVSPRAQREYRKTHAEALAANFDLEAIGFPVVSMRGGRKWVVDGQHRIAALKMVGFTDSDQIQVECYLDLTEQEEAELFLRRDERKKVGTFDRFRIAVVAGRDTERGIENVVRDCGYRIAKGKATGSVGAVESLKFAYNLSPDTLRRTLHILGGAFDGDSSAFTAEMIKGMALVCERYNGSMDDDRAVSKLAGLSGGPVALKRKTEALKLRTGHNGSQCCAGAIVDALNGGRGGFKLGSWWS